MVVRGDTGAVVAEVLLLGFVRFGFPAGELKER